MELPVVQTISAHGLTFRIRAIPWGLARRAAAKNADMDAIAAEIYEKLVSVDAPAEKPPIDELPVELVEQIIGACGTRGGNPMTPPQSLN